LKVPVSNHLLSIIFAIATYVADANSIGRRLRLLASSHCTDSHAETQTTGGHLPLCGRTDLIEHATLYTTI